MKMICQLVVLLGLAAGQAVAQQTGREASATSTNSSALHDDSRLLAPLLEDTKGSQELLVVKKIELGGPVIKPLKVKKLSEVPRVILQLINPFAPSERKIEFQTTRGLSTRAWSTVVGWHPGGSAFSDPMTHEPSMALVSLNRSSRD
jgi:hypothetical protein